MATIRKRGPYQWEVRIRKKGYPAQSKTLESKKDAEDWAHDIESEMRRGVFVCRKEAENTTLTEALDRYAKEITVNKKCAPQELLRIKAWKHLPLSQRFLATLRSVDFAQYRDNRQTQGKSPSTIRLELAIISHLTEIRDTPLFFYCTTLPFSITCLYAKNRSHRRPRISPPHHPARQQPRHGFFR
jgi:hypothetical protein